MGVLVAGLIARPPPGPFTLAVIAVVRQEASAQGLSGAGLARRAGLTAGTVQKMLRGALAPSTDQLQALLAGLGLSMVAVLVRATNSLQPAQQGAPVVQGAGGVG